MDVEYDIGDLVRITAEFTDSGGAAIDPTTVSAAYRDPAGTVTTLVYGVDPEVVQDSAGHYHADINITRKGTWHYRWFSTGEGQAAAEGWFRVCEQKVI